MHHVSPNLEAEHSAPAPRYVRFFAIMSVSLLPVIMMTITTLIASHGHWQNVLPSWSDEIMHWHQVATAMQAGLNGGYYTLWEQPAPLETFHFYAWGPWPYFIYAVPGSLFGWGPYTLPLFNLTVLTLSLAVFCWAARLNLRQLGVLALVLLTFWPGLLFYPLSMLDVLHYALAVLLAALCISLWRQGEHASLVLKVGLLVFIAFIAFLRPSWVIVLLPCLLVMFGATRKVFILSMIATVVVGLFLTVLFEQVRAPYLLGGQGILAAGHPLTDYLHRIGTNLKGFFSFRKHAAEGAFTLQFLFVLLLGTIPLLERLKRLKHLKRLKRLKWLSEQEGVFHVLNLGGILAASIILYHAGEGHELRAMSAQLLLSMLVMLYFKRYRPLILMVVISLLFLPGVWAGFQERIDSKMLRGQADLTAFKASLSNHLIYEPDQTNPWCNTLNIYVQNFRAELIEVPAGIGIGFFISGNDPMPMRSRYWLLEPSIAEAIQVANPSASLTPIAETPLGMLYLNSAADCKLR